MKESNIFILGHFISILESKNILLWYRILLYTYVVNTNSNGNRICCMYKENLFARATNRMVVRGCYNLFLQGVLESTHRRNTIRGDLCTVFSRVEVFHQKRHSMQVEISKDLFVILLT